MPITDKDEYRAYMRSYMAERYRERRAEAVIILGSKCGRCPAVERLQIDHIDPSKKTMSVDRMCYVSRERFLDELSRCQLLCEECHSNKTVVEDCGKKLARGTHGTISSYRYCRCEPCRKAHAEYQQIYRKQRKERTMKRAEPDKPR